MSNANNVSNVCQQQNGLHHILVMRDGAMLCGRDIADERGGYIIIEDSETENRTFRPWTYERDYGVNSFSLNARWHFTDSWSEKDLKVIYNPFEKFCYYMANRWGSSTRLSDEDYEEANEFIEAFIDSVPGCDDVDFETRYEPDADDPDMEWEFESYGADIYREKGAAVAFCEERDINPFDFIYDSHYKIMIDDPQGGWQRMKNMGLVDMIAIEEDYIVPGA